MKSKDYKSVSQPQVLPSSMRGFLKGFLVACLLTFILLSISALILTYTPISESSVSAFSMISVLISAFIGGIVTAGSAKNRGFIKGAISGGAYILMLYIIASLGSENFTFDSHTVLLFIIGIVAGSFGGIVGINKTKKRKR